MKSEEVYNTWKEKKRQVDIRENFADDVMSRAYQYEQNKRKPLFDMQWLVELISTHPLAKAGLVTAGAVAGIVRLVFMILVILGKGDING